VKTIFVTGLTRGLGKSIAEVFAANNWNVCGIYSNKSEHVENAWQCDVRDREKLQEVFKEVVNKCGGVDVLVNNAAINKNQLARDTTEADWNEVIGVNLTGIFNVCKEVVPLMRKKGGHIINISSVSGLKGREGQCHYVASKAGVIGFSKSLAREVACWNIKVNVILPGYMKTNMLDEKYIARAESENLLGKINTTQDAAGFIYQLTQTDFISGQVFNLDSRIL